jgi:hypothetical protein
MFRPHPKSGPTPKKEKKPLKRSAIKQRKKITGEAALFREIAEERPWVDFVTGEPLPFLTPTNFLHVLPKALNKFPKMKLCPSNIVLGSDKTHFDWDNRPRSELRKNPMWDKMFELEAQLIDEYKLM